VAADCRCAAHRRADPAGARTVATGHGCPLHSTAGKRRFAGPAAASPGASSALSADGAPACRVSARSRLTVRSPSVVLPGGPGIAFPRCMRRKFGNERHWGLGAWRAPNRATTIVPRRFSGGWGLAWRAGSPLRTITEQGDIKCPLTG
jgi:hypothetical protein